MNDRIKELAKEANLADIIDDAYQERHDWQPFVEKFAELIVRECCGAADDWYQKHSELHWDPAQHIRNHFGVEE